MAKQPAPKSSLFRRHPFRTGATLLIAACLAAACTFFATFDLNAYRESLASGLSEALAQPVTIDSANMSWQRGPAFDIAGIRIGDPLADPVVEIEHLFLQPRLLPLLRGIVVFDDMILVRPQYKLDLLPSDSFTGTEVLTTLLRTVQVRNLTVVDGRLDLDDRRTTGPSNQLQLRAVELKIGNLLTGRPGKLELSARLLHQEEVADLNVEGRVAMDSDMSNWRQVRGNLQVQLKNIAAEQIFAWLPPPPGSPMVAGKAALNLSTEGSVATGLHFTASLAGQNLALVWPSRYSQAPSIKNFAVSGIWTASKGLDKFSDLSLQLDNLSLQGHLSLQRSQNQPWLEGTLSSSPLALADIRRFVPDRIRLSDLKLLHASLDQGTVEIHHLRFAGPLEHVWQAGSPLPINDARITLSDARLPLPGAPPLEQLNLALTLKDGDLHLHEGTALLMDSPVRFSGTAEHLLREDRSVSFSAEWAAPAHKLWNELAANRDWTGKAGGTIPVTLSLTGSPGQLRGNMQANLAGCVLDWPGIVSKPAGSPAELRLSGHQQNQALIVEAGLFSLSPFDLEFSGQIGLTDKFPLELRLHIPRTDLGKAAQLVPALASYRPSGTLAMNGQLAGPLAKPVLTGQVRLDAATLDINVLEAEARDINGTIAIRNQQCRFTGVQARLGQSAITLDGELTGEVDRVFTLHFKAPRVGAGEIIFPGSKVVFRNLDGSIVFSRDRIRYEDIRFNLETGQAFQLQGSQGLSAPVMAELDIHAKMASIDEVLALWEAEAPPKPPEIKDQRSQHRLVIRAAVDKGRYGPLSFSDARGTIVAENDTVAISPLSFRTGSGTGQGQVLVDNGHETQSALTISGKFADIDAGYLHNELLQQKGLVTGKLSGQVQLQGPAGPDLLTTGTGQADLHIKDGVLRKFSFLSKVFSLLNVSQLFTLHLPDMASQGMPFTSLDGSFDLRQGRLTTEDLAVASNAMNLSLVGSVDLRQDRLDLLMGVKPFGTVDKIVSKIPVAGWILTGENKALITAHFRIQGSSEAPEVNAIPITSVSEKVLGIFQRVLGLPGKVVSDVNNLFQDEKKSQNQAGRSESDNLGQRSETGRAPQ